MNKLTEISITVDSHEDGTYDIYMATENSSGETCNNITARKIGENVADLIDTLEEANSGKSFLKDRYELIATDGYSIDRTVYASKELARQAMEKAYNELDHNEKDDEWDEASHITDSEALLYDRGDSVYVWSIFKCE